MVTSKSSLAHLHIRKLCLQNNFFSTLIFLDLTDIIDVHFQMFVNDNPTNVDQRFTEVFFVYPWHHHDISDVAPLCVENYYLQRARGALKGST